MDHRLIHYYCLRFPRLPPCELGELSTRVDVGHRLKMIPQTGLKLYHHIRFPLCLPVSFPLVFSR